MVDATEDYSVEKRLQSGSSVVRLIAPGKALLLPFYWHICRSVLLRASVARLRLPITFRQRILNPCR